HTLMSALGQKRTCGRSISEAKLFRKEPVVVGTDVQARVFTLAPDEFIPWHCHSESTDHYFVLSGTLSITTRDPNDELMLESGGRYKIKAGTSHLIANRAKSDCVFLLVQGVGKYDFIKSAD